MNLRIFVVLIVCLFVVYNCKSDRLNHQYSIKKTKNSIVVKAGILEKVFQITKKKIVAVPLLVNKEKIVDDGNKDFSVTLWKANPNEKPQGINNLSEAGIEQQNSEKNLTDALNIEMKEREFNQTVEWTDSVTIAGENIWDAFNVVNYLISKREKGKQRLEITYSASEKTLWKGLTVQTVYEIYEGYPAIRKKIRFTNKSAQWIKINNLIIDGIEVTGTYSHKTLMTPDSRGVSSSIVAFSNSTKSEGIITVNEVPSKLRYISEDGALGYTPDYFEWVLGPSEFFESEPVFVYGFSGSSYDTKSSTYTALDSCVENDFKSFLREKIVMKVDENKKVAPLFCTWTNYNANINDSNMHVAADIASRIGFKCFQLDAGWSDTGPNSGWAVTTTKADVSRFPDMEKMSDFIRSKNMKIGLWYSVFLNEEETMEAPVEPVLFSLPLIKRAGGLGLSFCYSKSRKKYINEIIYLNTTFQADYFKQDLSNICYGDFAFGHESRTLKESYLRGLRGLFATQDEIHRQAPGVWLQLSHEIYWETPGPAADVAVLKHADSYHASPNEYWGAGNRKKLVSSLWKYNVDSLQEKLIEGAFRARNLLYSHRGLPLERIEIFGAVTTNFNSSLTTKIQDRQICSWLMGAPLSFSGDLTSLTEENIEHYHKRFEMLDRLEKKYGIYSLFQFSGVPSPTDEDWHWWGKLNQDGVGIMVVMRGRAGEDFREINIPWVNPEKEYQLKALFSSENFGNYSGEQLKEGKMMLGLEPYGQEIIELTIVK